MKTTKRKEVFVDGPISPGKISESIDKHSTMTEIGAHSIFLGQVRADVIEGRRVQYIDYSCYKDMADNIMHEIREEAFTKFQLSCMHIYHSLGRVEAGKISLFVFTSSRHRAMAIDACTFVVEEIKTRLPVWGKEVFDDETHSWKNNQ